jgi:hypothetical protein
VSRRQLSKSLSLLLEEIVSRLEVKIYGFDLVLMGLSARLDAARCGRGRTLGSPAHRLGLLSHLDRTLTSAFRGGPTHGRRKEPVEGPRVPDSAAGRFR